MELLESWENNDLVIQEIIMNPGYMKLLFDVALNSKHSKSWRAAWLADKINNNNPELIEPYLDLIISSLTPEASSSLKRHLLKLISLHPIPEKYISKILDYSLNCFSSASEPVAVRVHALQILYNISEIEPDFKPELLEIIAHESEIHSSPGITSRGKKLAKKLHLQIRQSGIRFI